MFYHSISDPIHLLVLAVSAKITKLGEAAGRNRWLCEYKLKGATWDKRDGMRRLPGEVRERFQSDMRIVLDYLAEGKDYQPTSQPIVHLKEFLRLMKEVSGDTRYEEILSQLEEKLELGGEITMCELLDKYENRVIEKGIRKGIRKGVRQGVQLGIKALVETCQEFGLTQAETVAKMINKFSMSQDEGMKYMQRYWQ